MSGPDSVSGATVGDIDRIDEGASGLDQVETLAGNLTTGGRRKSQTLFTFGADFVVLIKTVSVGPPVNILEGFIVQENGNFPVRKEY